MWLVVALVALFVCQTKVVLADDLSHWQPPLNERLENTIVSGSHSTKDHSQSIATAKASRWGKQATQQIGKQEQVESPSNWFRKLQSQLVEHSIKQSATERDHLMMDKWLIDNVNALHRRLKQMENDFENYVQVTKNTLAQNWQQLVTAKHLPRDIAVHRAHIRAPWHPLALASHSGGLSWGAR